MGAPSGLRQTRAKPFAPARLSPGSIQSFFTSTLSIGSRRMENWRCGSGAFRMNVALSELPDFTALPGRAPAEHHAAGIIIAPSLAYMERAYFDARSFGWSRHPIVEMVIPSTLDDTLGPCGQHVASLFCQHVAPRLPDGSSWDNHRDAVADLMIETVDAYAPNFRRSVLGRQIFSPLDLERTFGLVDGDIFHGKLDLGQIFSARPMLGYADYRGPVAGLYLCGIGNPSRRRGYRRARPQCRARNPARFPAQSRRASAIVNVPRSATAGSTPKTFTRIVTASVGANHLYARVISLSAVGFPHERLHSSLIVA
jgi:hypothetical protein